MAAGSGVNPRATLTLPVPGVAVQQWMWPKGELLASPENDISTVTELTASSKDTTAAPVAVEVGTGSPALARVVENTVVIACAGVARSNAVETAAKAAETDLDFMLILLENNTLLESVRKLGHLNSASWAEPP